MAHLDVLLVEDRPGIASREEGVVAAAGHRVHRCYEPGAFGSTCRGILTPGTCPLDAGVDVALVVRGSSPPGDGYDMGRACAVWASVPVVDQESRWRRDLEPVSRPACGTP